ncbi:hypothetical protein JCM16303_002538 [Sporobolomyces ruberrimus]
MDLTRLLNEPLPPMRSPPPRAASDTTDGNPSSFTSFASRPDPPRPLHGFAPPPHSTLARNSSESQPGPPTSFTDSVLYSSSRSTIEAALEAFRRESHSVIDFQYSTNLSVYAVQEAFNSLDSWPGTQLDLWAVWSQITWLTELARVPTFPINPDKVALLLSVYVDLPCSKVVRESIRHRQTLLEPEQVLLLLHGMEVAGKASKDYWPGATSFVQSSDNFPSTRLVRSLVSHKVAQKPVINGFAPPKPPPPPRSVAQQPAPSFYGPSKTMLAAQERISQTLPQRSLRDLCAQLPSILRDLKTLPDDPQVFDIAQLRFQNASSAPAYVLRMPDLVQAAILYTNITALLCFPTYPIDSVKLAVFALAFTPGPLGEALLQASPEHAKQQQYIRMSGKDMEKIMKDLTAVRDITRGGSAGIPEAESRDWQTWLRDLTLDWKSVEPPETKGTKDRQRPSQPGPPRKRMKLSPSPTNSEVMRESVKTVTDRPSLSKKETFKAPPPSDRSTPAPSIPESVSSPEVAAKPLPKGKAKKAKSTPTAASTKKAAPSAPTAAKARKNASSSVSSRASTPASSVTSVAPSVPSRPALAPRWVPKVKGKIPDHIPMPPVPPIRPSTRWLKQNRIKTEEDGSVEDDAGDDDEEEAPRTIAASRPKRRGGLQMIPYDVETLWALARKVGYTEEALAEEAAKNDQP